LTSAAKRVVVVGAGPGGLAAATRLRERASGRLELVLVAPGPRATFLAGTLEVALGEGEPDHFTADVGLDGVRCIDAAVGEVARGGVRIGGEWLAADAVIAAPGLALAYDAVPRWPRAVSAWDPAAAARVAAALSAPEAGRLLIAACSLPYRCPPAPFALAIRLHEQHHHARHMVGVTVATPEPVPLAGVGGEAPAFVMDSCTTAGVAVERGFGVDLDASQDGVLRANDGRQLTYDTALLVPPHVRPACLSALPGEGVLVAVGERGSVEGTTLYVVGDAAATGLPRAAGVAQATAVAAADGVLEALGIRPAPPPPPVEASCFMHHHGGAVSRLRVSFTGGQPRVEIDGPSLDLALAREGERRRFLASADGRPRASR
jgi:sulfide:quinone oxidoreductase